MSIALRVLPSKLELKRRDGTGILAPRANVSFTTFVYASPVQTIPWCERIAACKEFHRLGLTCTGPGREGEMSPFSRPSLVVHSGMVLLFSNLFHPFMR